MSRLWPRRYRVVVVACGLALLLVGHGFLRFLSAILFGFVKYRELAPWVPSIVFLGHTLSLAGAGVFAAVRRGVAGLLLGIGLLVLAVEPLSSSFVAGDGCEVSATAGTFVAPEVAYGGGAIRLYTWSGACTATLSTVTLGVAVLFLVAGLWLGTLPDTALSRWMALVRTHWLPRSHAE